MTQYRGIFGCAGIPTGKYYWTLCGLQPNRPGCELLQMVQEGFLARGQYVGVNNNEGDIASNRMNHPEAVWVYGDMTTSFRRYASEYPPALVFYDSQLHIESEQLAREGVRLLEECPGGTLICINAAVTLPTRKMVESGRLLDRMISQNSDLSGIALEGHYAYRSSRMNMCMHMFRKKVGPTEELGLPSFKVSLGGTSKERVPFEKPKYGDPIRPREGQQKALKVLGGKDRTLCIAPPGWGKSYLIKFQAVSKTSIRKSLILAPFEHLLAGYSRRECLEIEGDKKYWGSAHQYGQGTTKVRFLKDWLLSEPTGESIATACSAGWVGLWKECSEPEKRKMSENLDIYIDECHHLTEEGDSATLLGRTLSEILSYQQGTGVHLYTATFFRTDKQGIVSKGEYEKFVRYRVPMDQHFRDIGLTNMTIDFTFYSHDGILRELAKQIKCYPGESQIVVLPRSNMGFRVGG